MISGSRVLVAYASARGATRGIAEEIGKILRSSGFAVDVLPVADVAEIAPYSGVVIGSGLYGGRWRREARKFVARFANQLRQRPVWMFSSGPLDTSADADTLEPTRSVARLVERVRARAHATFGGALAADAEGILAMRLAKDHAGDWRDWGHIRRWANRVAIELAAAPDVPPPHLVGPMRAGGGVLAMLCLIIGVAAFAGGISMLLWPDGSALRLSPDQLRHSSFADFTLPGLLLTLIGVWHLTAGALVIGETPHADEVAFTAGLALLVWIVAEMALLRTGSWLQLATLVIALGIIAQAIRRHANLASAKPLAHRLL